jgi:hypothetical protein
MPGRTRVASVTPPIDLRQAAGQCLRVPEPRADEGTCGICGHTLPVNADAIAEVA